MLSTFAGLEVIKKAMFDGAPGRASLSVKVCRMCTMVPTTFLRVLAAQMLQQPSKGQQKARWRTYAMPSFKSAMPSPAACACKAEAT